MSIVKELDRIKIDWTDFIKASAYTRSLLHDLCSDSRAITELGDHMLNSSKERGMCEEHQLLDLLVLYDAIDRGFRVRLHLATDDHIQRAHDHRYSFSTYILNGEYEHIIYSPKLDPYKLSPFEVALKWQDRRNADPNFNKENEVDFSFLFKRQMTKDSCLTLHHSVVHSVVTTKGTSSLVIRGPAEKERSFIYDVNENKLWWRFGHQNESQERRKSKVMTESKLLSSVELMNSIVESR